jgi:hypothetical protein
MTAVPDDPRDRIRGCARHSIGRAWLFALLAIAATMSGLIGWPVMAMRTGAILSMLTAAILALRAVRAPGRPYRRTETWILLGRAHGLPEAQAQRIIASILADTYWRFATASAALALGFWCGAFLFALAGRAAG